MRPPELIVAADWSANAPGRRLARGYHVASGRYVVCPPEPVGEPRTLVKRLLASLPPTATLLVGFDFPIGLPKDYATLAGVTSFREALGLFGRGRWKSFFEVTDRPSRFQPFGPKSNRKGGLRREQLAAALGLEGTKQLYRLCDGDTKARPRAEALFFTRFAKQVGRAAISGWQDVLAPDIGGLRVWPFDGGLDVLIARPGVVVSEIYPAEALRHLCVSLSRNAGPGKKRRSSRRELWLQVAQPLRAEAIELTSAAREHLESGCASSDDFDAVIGLLSMVLVVQGRRSSGVPDEAAVRSVEGWILGQDLTSY